MPKIVEKVEVVKLTCEECGHSSSDKEELKTWIEIRSSIKPGLILLEKNDPTRPYESFHVPNKKLLTFCKKDCALKFLSFKTNLFLAEIAQK